jgi:hypothetical protein
MRLKRDFEQRRQGIRALAVRVQKQRFFGQVLLSMKLPTVIAAVHEHLAAGQSVVIQLVSTAEAFLTGAWRAQPRGPRGPRARPLAARIRLMLSSH